MFVLLIARRLREVGRFGTEISGLQHRLTTVAAPGDRPYSVRNSCVIERICSVFVPFQLCIVCRLGMIVIRLRQISSIFSKCDTGTSINSITYLLSLFGKTFGPNHAN